MSLPQERDHNSYREQDDAEPHTLVAGPASDPVQDPAKQVLHTIQPLPNGPHTAPVAQ